MSKCIVLKNGEQIGDNLFDNIDQASIYIYNWIGANISNGETTNSKFLIFELDKKIDLSIYGKADIYFEIKEI